MVKCILLKKNLRFFIFNFNFIKIYLEISCIKDYNLCKIAKFK